MLQAAGEEGFLQAGTAPTASLPCPDTDVLANGASPRRHSDKERVKEERDDGDDRAIPQQGSGILARYTKPNHLRRSVGKDKMVFRLLEEVAGKPPSERYGHSAVEYKGYIYIFGEKRTWSKVKSGKIRPKGRHFHSAVVFKGSMYIFGGKNNGYMNDLYCFDLEKHKWREVETAKNSRPSKRYGHIAVVHEEQMIVFGGYDDFGLKCNDMYEFNLRTETWKEISVFGDKPSVRFHCSGVVYKASLYLFGGNPASNDIYEFRFSTNTWSLTKTLGEIPQPRWGHRAIVTEGGLMYVVGGFSGAPDFEHLFVYNFETRKWAKLNAGDYKRAFHSLVAYNDEMIAFGGRLMDNNLNDLYIYAFEKSGMGRPCTFIEDFMSLVDDPEFSDVIFIFPKEKDEGKRTLLADRNILAARCERFRVLFGVADGHDYHREAENNIVEGSNGAEAERGKEPVEKENGPNRKEKGKEKEKEKEKDEGRRKEVSTHNGLGGTSLPIEITETEFGYDTYKHFIFYLYTGEVRLDNQKDALPLMVIADLYSLDHLKFLCAKYLMTCVNLRNVARLFKKADDLHSAELKAFCLNYILKNYQFLKAGLKEKLPSDLLQQVRKAAQAASAITPGTPKAL